MEKRTSLRETIKNATFVSVCIGLLGVISLLASINLHHTYSTSIWTEILRDLGILLTSIGVISMAYELLLRQQLLSDYNDLLRQIVDPDARRLGVVHLFRSRADKLARGFMPDVLMKGAAHDVIGLGLGLVNFVPEQRELIRAKIEQGCRFRFLICDVAGPGAETLDRTLGYSNRSLLKYIAPAADAFKELQESFLKAGIGRDRFDVRVYDIVPPWGMLAIDQDAPGGRIYVEVNGHGVEGSSCPGFAVAHVDAGWFGFFSSQLAMIWQAARPLIPETATIPRVAGDAGAG